MTYIVIGIAIGIAIKFTEFIISKIMSWFRAKSESKKQYSYKRIVAIVSPELHSRLKAHVLLLNMSITEYILAAVTEKLKREIHG